MAISKMAVRTDLGRDLTVPSEFLNLLEELNVRPVVNASAPKSNFSGPPLTDDIAEIVGQAQKWSFDLADLNRRVGEYCARLLGAKSGLVTGGTSAGILLALETAKARRGVDQPEVVIRRGDFGHYAYLFQQAGCALREVGNIVGCTRGDLCSGINKRTVAVAVVQSPRLPEADLTLRDMVQVSKEHGIPVIADCAAIFPSRQRVKELVSTGCEAILLSGGKIVGGPQASGLLLGDKDFVRLSSEISFPNDGALRSVKIDRGQLMGIAAAVRKFSQIDEKTLRDEYQTRCQLAVSVLGDLAGASVSVLPEILIEHVPMIAIKDNGALEHSFFERLSQRLLDRPQPIGVHYIRARRLICISPIGLSDETMQIVCHAVRDEWAKLIDDML